MSEKKIFTYNCCQLQDERNYLVYHAPSVIHLVNRLTNSSPFTINTFFTAQCIILRMCHVNKCDHEYNDEYNDICKIGV